MKKYQAVIFDLDGTLLDTKYDIANTANHTLKCLGAETIPNEEIYKHVGYGIRNLVIKSLPDQSPETIQKGMQLFTDYYYEHCTDHTDFYPGAREMLTELKHKKIARAVLTNKPHLYANLILTRLKSDHLFDFILGADHGFPLKPDPKTTNYVLECLKVFPDYTLMVGDTSVDLNVARNVGMDCALMAEGYGTHDDLNPIKDFAVGVFKTFDELRVFLNSQI